MLQKMQPGVHCGSSRRRGWDPPPALPPGTERRRAPLCRAQAPKQGPSGCTGASCCHSRRSKTAQAPAGTTAQHPHPPQVRRQGRWGRACAPRSAIMTGSRTYSGDDQCGARAHNWACLRLARGFQVTQKAVQLFSLEPPRDRVRLGATGPFKVGRRGNLGGKAF